MLWRRLRSLLRGRLVEAEVIDWEPHRLPAAVKRAPRAPGDRSDSTATPILRIRTETGETVTARLDAQLRRKSWYRYPRGSFMPVRVDPGRPGIVYPPSWGSMIVFPGLLAMAGTLMLLLALGMYFGAPSSS
jgi:hypothetical protein